MIRSLGIHFNQVGVLARNHQGCKSRRRLLPRAGAGSPRNTKPNTKPTFAGRTSGMSQARVRRRRKSRSQFCSTSPLAASFASRSVACEQCAAPTSATCAAASRCTSAAGSTCRSSKLFIRSILTMLSQNRNADCSTALTYLAIRGCARSWSPKCL